jgi:hypothetical protein
MRSRLAFALLLVLLVGCTPEIPVKPDFGTSALRPTGNIPSEFAAFNNFDAAINPLLAHQICATPYIPRVEHTAQAVPGTLVTARGECEIYFPSLGDPNGQSGR